MAEFLQVGAVRDQWKWLLGRIAAKDAIRLWLKDAVSNEMLHPANLPIASDGSGNLWCDNPNLNMTIERIQVNQLGESAAVVTLHLLASGREFSGKIARTR
jgi:hypothetical protein